MWAPDEPTFRGRFYQIEKAWSFPKPVQKPHPPILIGGGGKKVLEIAGKHADIMNLNPPVTRGFVDLKDALKFDKPELERRIAMVRNFPKSARRSPDAIEISGGSFVLMAKDKAQADAMVAATAQAMG